MWNFQFFHLQFDVCRLRFQLNSILNLHPPIYTQDTNILGFKGPRNMTVLLPGMTEDDQRVKISSCDPSQQGLLDSWKTKVKHHTICFKHFFG